MPSPPLAQPISSLPIQVMRFSCTTRRHIISITSMPQRQTSGTTVTADTVADITVETGLMEDAVTLALCTLENAQLLNGPPTTTLRGTQSRRIFATQVGVAAVPAIVSITAPIAKAAVSGGECKNSDDCKRFYGTTIDGKDVDWNCSGAGHPSGKGVCYHN